LTGWTVQNVLSGDVRFLVWFNIVNPTHIPITLHFVSTRVEGGQSTDSVIGPMLLPDNPVAHCVTIIGNKEQSERFQGSRLVITLETTVLFADAFGKHWKQVFGRYVLCGNDGTKVTDTKNTMEASSHAAPKPIPPGP
jgi:hypothetical protein